MHRRGGPNGELIVSATDLVGFLECGHLTNLEMQAVAGLIHKPSQRDDPDVLLLQRRGLRHEQRYIDLLESRGREVVRGDDDWDHAYEDRAAATLGLMRQGADVIYQATVFDGRWLGFPDFLLRKEGAPNRGTPTEASATEASATQASATQASAKASSPTSLSRFYRSDDAGIHRDDSKGAADLAEANLGLRRADVEPSGAGVELGARTGLGQDWHYEVADTKLAHVAKASALVQIASYVEQISRIQGVTPEQVYVVTGGATPEEHPFRTAEMMAFYGHAKQRFEDALAADLDPSATYPDPVEHCAVCKWYGDYCWRQWRQDDALPLVAGISRAQRQALTTHHVMSRGALAQLDKPFDLGLKRGQNESMWRVREQARLQVASDGLPKPMYELLDPERDSAHELVADRGLSALPPPNEADLFFDIEGDPFAFWEGLEYLFGVWVTPAGESIWDQDSYRAIWSYDEEGRQFTREAEKRAFEEVMDLFTERLATYPDMHIYHYGVYEPAHLKALVARHATREEELDQLLRGRVFVDLYRVVKQGLRVGTESYSIKKLEPLYGYIREVELRDANSSIVEFESMLEDGDPDGAIKEKIQLYNRDDCVSTEKLRDWLELRRAEAKRQFGFELPRPPGEIDEPGQEFTARQQAVHDLEERLTASISADPAEQSDADRATWLMRHLLDWHRRENKSMWWRFFELMSLSEDDLVAEPEPIGQLEFVGMVEGGGTKQSDDYLYQFPTQEHKVEVGNTVHDPEIIEGKTVTGSVQALDDEARTVVIRRPKTWAGHHPESIVPLKFFGADAQQKALMKLGEWIASNGVASASDEWRVSRDLLLREYPRVVGLTAGDALAREGESGAEAAFRLATSLNRTTLPIQGPPGSGKTTTGAQMILKLVGEGRNVGITANSHKVIANLVSAVLAAGNARVIQRANEKEDCLDHASVTRGKNNDQVADGLRGDQFDIAAGTAWLWADEKLDGTLDTLFVDEAGQMSLANVIAMSGCARNIVLLGDPQQLEQPTQGVHPDGAGASALGHLLKGLETVPADRGVFLERTWRMHPAITRFTSDLFYEGKLESAPGLELQEVVTDEQERGFEWLAGSGLRWTPVRHDGNTNSSAEEAEVVVELVRRLVRANWVDARGETRSIGQEGVLIVSPFNAHRLLIDAQLAKAGLGGVQVGTVDKFQGQQAPVSIYTMATSRPEDAPRGMAFLYSLNRLNVATSRARALAIVVASSKLLDVVPGTPDQLRMANALCAVVDAS